MSAIGDQFPTPRGNNFMPAPVPNSPSSSSVSISPAVSSAPWSRDSFTTHTSAGTEFDDLYDVSDDEDYRQKKMASQYAQQPSIHRSNASKRLSASSISSRASLPTLIIPFEDGGQWNEMAAFKKLSSPIPPTPPPKVPMSPAIFSYLASQEVLSISAPPSLDGSLDSDQLAAMSAPSTPDMGNEEDAGGDMWSRGVQLHPAAMATLQALSGEDDMFQQQTEQVIELSQMSPSREMQQSPPRLVTNIRRNSSIVLSPTQQASLDSLTRLEIPSPGGFFSGLTAGARHTWHLVSASPQSAHPPSSATAEHFYKAPWSSMPIERIVEVCETISEGEPTARPSVQKTDSDCTLRRPDFPHQDSDETVTGAEVTASPVVVDEEIVATEILADYDARYVRNLNSVGCVNFDRTGLWLSAQTSYLAALINPPEERDDEAALKERDAASVKEASAPARKTVRFSEIVTQDVACPLPRPGRQESAYFRSFQRFINESRYRDIFVHRIARFEALQAQRISLSDAHRAQLLGKFQLSVVPLSAKRRLSANVARGDEIAFPEDQEKMKQNREREAMEQLGPANWNVMALRMLNGGRLIAAPVAKKLSRLSLLAATAAGTPRDRARILDLGGQATCDWAWHCALEYPNSKVYTITTKSTRQMTNSNIRGPHNHRKVAVDKLYKLPFKDNQFDLISARNIYSILKLTCENGEDEYDRCLRECMRCLKPGGYLEFSILDSDLVNPGPLGQARSVEFGFNLRTRGYDAQPSKAWLGRLRKAGFVNIKRAWLFLPMGAPVVPASANRDSLGVELPSELEAMVCGSTNAAASITGLLGSWAWEKWMLKLEMESGKEEKALLDGVYRVFEEGRKCGAGWRTLNGWAKKAM